VSVQRLETVREARRGDGVGGLAKIEIRIRCRTAAGLCPPRHLESQPDPQVDQQPIR
jgi:hypothetical protein